MFSLITKNLKLLTSKGFSLVEMVIVVGIIALITSVILINHTVFNGGVILESLAYEVALVTRQAQFFSINVLQTGTGANASFEHAYGVYFNTDQNDQFIMFADLNDDGEYTSTPNEAVEVYNITRGNIIKYLCVDDQCLNPESSDVTELSVTFKRPDPDAMMSTNNTFECGVDNTGCSYAKIYVGSTNPKVKSKYIFIGRTGQISIGNE